MNFSLYKKMVGYGCRPAIKLEWLNPDESVRCDFTNATYDINANVNVNKQNGCRRTCTVKLNNDINSFPIELDNIWIGQKFKLWMGIYLDESTPYYLPQGVFYVSNPTEVYNPSERTITLNGVDKWAYLDGTLHGKLSGSYQTNVDVDLYDAIRKLLTLPVGKGSECRVDSDNIRNYFDIKNFIGNYSAENDVFVADSSVRNSGTFSAVGSGTGNNMSSMILTAKQDINVSFSYYCRIPNTSNIYSRPRTIKIYVDDKLICSERWSDNSKVIKDSYSGRLSKGKSISFECDQKENNTMYPFYFYNVSVSIIDKIDPIPPLLSPSLLTKTTKVKDVDSEIEKSVLKCPYTATVERGQSYADVLLEYATILCANVYYDENGRFVLEPIIDTADDITDTNKEILWDYTVDEQTFLGLTQTYNFDKVYNDFIVLGNVVNGYQFKGRVQNRNPLSDTCIQAIGLKTKEPYENNQYVSDEQCVELAKYYAKTDTIIQKSATIPSITLYHLDVDKLVTVSTPNNNMAKELFLINGFSLSSSGTMSLNVCSVNILKDFSVVEVDVYE